MGWRNVIGLTRNDCDWVRLTTLSKRAQTNGGVRVAGQDLWKSKRRSAKRARRTRFRGGQRRRRRRPCVSLHRPRTTCAKVLPRDESSQSYIRRVVPFAARADPVPDSANSTRDSEFSSGNIYKGMRCAFVSRESRDRRERSIL